ncbi:hypothetical protein TCAL_10486 [Tigriopus californicus]|uniref:Uncharacterized protein n=1 Tax=Tigriopus californicus TaxID=6832 RepID=A0A553PRZ8_TIGCA|nr:hypothetical protein TCAL_10486 [Tigriopus californicus]
MFVKWSPLFFATTLMLLVLNPSETEAKRPASRKRYDMFWYGPVSNPDDCLAHDRSRDLVLKRKMFQDPSDLCTQRDERMCVCLRKVNRFKRRQELYQDLEHDFYFSCSTCHYTSNFSNKQFFITFE